MTNAQQTTPATNQIDERTASDDFRPTFVEAARRHLEQGFIVEELAIVVRWYAVRVGVRLGLTEGEASLAVASWDVRELMRDVQAA